MKLASLCALYRQPTQFISIYSKSHPNCEIIIKINAFVSGTTIPQSREMELPFYAVNTRLISTIKNIIHST